MCHLGEGRSSADPRIEAALDNIELAAGRPYSVQPKAQPQPSTFEDELTEDELIELNERRNQSWFR